MKYPKAGDLQRATGVELASNPAKQNPYEVRSASGLEGVYADKNDAEFHAAELRREGVPGVTVDHRRRPSYADRAVAARALREEQQASATYAERAARTSSPELREVYEHAGEEEEQHAAMLRPFAKNPAGTYVGYHGSHKRFTNWQDSARFARLGDFGVGMYFSTSSSDAAKHGSEVYRATIELSNPLVVSSTMTPEMDRFRRAFKISDEDIQFADEGLWHAIIGLVNSLIEVGAASKQSVASVLRKMGHDGIVVPNAVVRQSRGNRDANGDYIVVLDAASIVDWGDAFATIDEWRAAARNPSSRLFTGVYPTGIVYADRAREVDGDYMRVAFLPFSTLQLKWSPGLHPPELRAEVESDAAAIIARRGELFEISSSGQTVMLGGEPALTRRPPGDNPGPRVLREKYGSDSEIVVEHNRYGITGWLESKRGGGRLPIAFSRKPETLREAIELSKEFLRRVYGRSNPAGLTAKGERMYEHIKAGYGDDPRAAEIASRTVQARATEIPGLKKKRR